MTFNIIKNAILLVSVSTFVYPSALPSAESLYHEPAALITTQPSAVPTSHERLSPTDSYRIIGMPTTSELRVYLTCSKFNHLTSSPPLCGHGRIITEYFDAVSGEFEIKEIDFGKPNGMRHFTPIADNAPGWVLAIKPLILKSRKIRLLSHHYVAGQWTFTGEESTRRYQNVMQAVRDLQSDLEQKELLGDFYGIWGKNCLLLCSEIIKKSGVDPKFKVMAYSNAPVVDGDYRIFYQKTSPTIMDYSRVILFGFIRDIMFMAALLPYKFFWNYVMGYKVPLKTRSNPVDGLQKED